MTDPCGQAGAYFDGELDDASRASFLGHLASCAVCKRDLDDAMQLDLRRPPAHVVARRSWTHRLARIAVPIFAAAAVVVLLVTRSRPAPVLLLGPTRSLEARLSYAGADRHRPLGVERGGQRAEAIPARTLAELEERGARDALAAAYLLTGAYQQAEAVLDTTPPSPQRDSDLAAVQLVRGAPAVALELADRAIAREPRLAPALWNRALALRELALPLAAATAFEAVAERGEVGWRDEASALAAALRAEVEDRRTAWSDAMTAGRAMVASDDTVMTDAQARRVPGLARLYFYDALRVASSPARLTQLMPLAHVLDEINGDGMLVRSVERAAQRDHAARQPLAASYRELAISQVPISDSAVDLALASFRRARADDLTLGALLHAGRAQTSLDELIRIAEAMGDPWFVLLARTEAAQALHNRGEALAAEGALQTALASCRSPGVAHRCLRLRLLLDNVHLFSYRVSELRRFAMELGTQARAAGDWVIENRSLIDRAEAERLAMRLPLMHALFEEIELREPHDCGTREYLRQVRADVALVVFDVDEAARQLESSQNCIAISPTALAAAVDVARLRPTESHRARARRWSQEYLERATPVEIPWVTVLRGRFEMSIDRTKGLDLLREGIRLADRQPASGLSKRARTIAYTSLIVDAAAAGDFTRTLEIFSAATDVQPTGCALGVALDDNRAVAVARLVDGTLRGAYNADRRRPLTNVDAVVPADLIAAFAACDHVSVLALPPLHGRANLLPAELPWSYRSLGSGETSALPPRRVVIAEPTTPDYLGLPRLGPIVVDAGAEVIRGPAATPGRVERELASATEVEVHAHGLVDLGASDSAFLALSPDIDGRFALTAGDVRHLRLSGRPILYLAACRTAEVAPQLHEAWSLPVAFVAAGARAVIASASPVPDREAPGFFAALRRRIAAGETPAVALARERSARLARDPESWVRGVILFD